MTKEDNIFKGAKFGDKFVTKDGRIALFLSRDNFSKYPVHMILEGRLSQTVYTTDGIPYIKDEDVWGWQNKEKVIEDLSIVSHYPELTDEEKS